MFAFKVKVVYNGLRDRCTATCHRIYSLSILNCVVSGKMMTFKWWKGYSKVKETTIKLSKIMGGGIF